MKIQLKRSSVLDAGRAKPPTAGQMEDGEIAVNFNTADPTLFIKDSAGAIVRVGNDKELQAQIDAINAQLAVLPDPLTGSAHQDDTLDERYVSRFSWADLPTV